MAMNTNAINNVNHAIDNAIESGWKLNITLSIVFQHTTQAERSTLIFSFAQRACDKYNAHSKSATVLGFKPSKRGGAPTIGDLMDDGSINTSKKAQGGVSNAAQTANRWFQRNIINAGFITTNPIKKGAKDILEQRAAWFAKLDAKDAKRFLRLIGA